MAQFTPSELSEREFTKSIRGYNPVEVDAYINRIVENYARLYRENIALEKRLAETEKRLKDAEDLVKNAKSDDALIREALVTAKKTGDAAIEEAYGKADEILASVKSRCDTILASFRDQIETQKKALEAMQAHVHGFKNELFEKYRLHIELLEQMTPVYEYNPERTADEYVEYIVSDLKEEVAAQYEVPNIQASSDTADFAPESYPVYDETREAATAVLASVKSEAHTAPDTAKKTERSAKKDGIPSVMSIFEDAEV